MRFIRINLAEMNFDLGLLGFEAEELARIMHGEVSLWDEPASKAAIEHLTRGFVCESEQEDVAGVDSVFEQVCHPISQRTRFSRACAGNHKDRTRRRGYRSKLLFIQLSGVIDVDRCGYWSALQRVLTRHVLVAHSDLDCRCKELQQPDVRKSRDDDGDLPYTPVHPIGKSN